MHGLYDRDVGPTGPTFGPRMVCTRYGTIGADARPNWRADAAYYAPSSASLC
jgi:hypothetical protein